MSSNLYLFDPKQSRNEIPEKPLADIMRDADIAWAEVSARIFRGLVSRISALFHGRKQANIAGAAAKPVVSSATARADEDRLAA
jgi:hypothetical protein